MKIGDRVVTEDGYEPDVLGTVLEIGEGTSTTIVRPGVHKVQGHGLFAVVQWDEATTIRPGSRAGTETLQPLNELMRVCPTCRSRGFDPSPLGPNRCSFCDGTEGGGNPYE